jgi:hypothetical protein
MSDDGDESDLRQVAKALSSIATWVKYLGTGNAGTSMGAIEFLAVSLKEGMERDQHRAGVGRRGNQGLGREGVIMANPDEKIVKMADRLVATLLRVEDGLTVDHLLKLMQIAALEEVAAALDKIGDGLRVEPFLSEDNVAGNLGLIAREIREASSREGGA